MSHWVFFLPAMFLRVINFLPVLSHRVIVRCLIADAVTRPYSTPQSVDCTSRLPKNRRTSTNEVNEVRLFRYLGNFLRIHLNNPNLSRVVIPNFLLFVFQNLEHKKSAPYFHVLDFCLRGSLNSRGIWYSRVDLVWVLLVYFYRFRTCLGNYFF